MKNKSMAIAAAILLSAGIAFAFSTAGKTCCQPAQSGNSAAASTEACCDMSCPKDACPLNCCGN